MADLSVADLAGEMSLGSSERSKRPGSLITSPLGSEVRGLNEEERFSMTQASREFVLARLSGVLYLEAFPFSRSYP